MKQEMTPAQAKNKLKGLPKSKLIAIIINLSDKVDLLEAQKNSIKECKED